MQGADSMSHRNSDHHHLQENIRQKRRGKRQLDGKLKSEQLCKPATRGT